MKTPLSIAFGGALLLAAACGEPAAPAIVAPVQTGSESARPAPPPAAESTPAPSTSVPAPAPPASSPAAASAEPAPAAAPPVGPACKTINDCWMDDDRKPIARPAKLRGKVIRPCKDGEHAPACVDGACVVRHFKC